MNNKNFGLMLILALIFACMLIFAGAKTSESIQTDLMKYNMRHIGMDDGIITENLSDSYIELKCELKKKYTLRICNEIEDIKKQLQQEAISVLRRLLLKSIALNPQTKIFGQIF